MSWIELKQDNDYEIYSEYPYNIRKKRTMRIISEFKDSDRYYQCKLNGKTYNKHRLIAEQFIPNDDPEHKTQVDHINHIREDNHIENLRWCTASENVLNRGFYGNQKFEYIDKLPGKAIKIKKYKGHVFNNLFYCGNDFYIYNGIQFRVINKLKKGKGESYYVEVRTIEGKRVGIFYNTFKKCLDSKYK